MPSGVKLQYQASNIDGKVHSIRRRHGEVEGPAQIQQLGRGIGSTTRRRYRVLACKVSGVAVPLVATVQLPLTSPRPSNCISSEILLTIEIEPEPVKAGTLLLLPLPLNAYVPEIALVPPCNRLYCPAAR